MANIEWTNARNELVAAVQKLGFRAELGNEIARQLGTPKAMERMLAYIRYVKPKTEELLVDEMLAICTDIEAWRRKKAGQEANARYTEMLNSGLPEDD